MRVVLLALLMLVTANAFAAGSPRSDLQGIRKEIRKKEALIRSTARIERKVTGELVEIDRNLREKEENLRKLGTELRVVETGLQKTMREAETVRQDAERKKEEIQQRLVALYKAGDIGAMRAFLSSESFPQMVENMRYMNAVLGHDRKLSAEYAERLKQLAELKERLEKDAHRKESIRSTIEEKKQEIVEEKARKATYLTKVKQDRKEYQASLRELEANARRLQAMVTRLEAMSRRSQTAKPEKGTTARRTVPEVPAYAGKGFAANRGRLSLPVKGQVVGGYGKHKHAEFNSFTFSNGMSISAPLGAEIRSIADGKVIFANYFKGYGNMMIVDHGEGFYSLYAHASRLNKKEGAAVEKNEVVASVGDVDSTKGPLLYFELRHQGKPVDPTGWFK